MTLVSKAVKIIDSCETRYHAIVAANWLNLAHHRLGHNTWDMLYNRLIDRNL